MNNSIIFSESQLPALGSGCESTAWGAFLVCMSTESGGRGHHAWSTPSGRKVSTFSSLLPSEGR